MFDLKSPCKNCPFRKRRGPLFQLSRERLEGIFEADAFQCHKTVDYSERRLRSRERPQQCAGLMAVLHRSRQPNQIMRIAMRLRHLDPDTLDPRREAYASVAAAMKAHTR